MKLRLSVLQKQDAFRPPGYTATILAAAQVDGDQVVLPDASWFQIRTQFYSIRPPRVISAKDCFDHDGNLIPGTPCAKKAAGLHR